MTNRTQYVKIGTAKSNMSLVSTGVPQGSIIGPLLYAILTNDMTETVKDRNCQMPEHHETERLFGKQCSRCGILSIYADDATFTVSSNTRVRNQILLKRNLDEIGLYLNDNLLSINMSKTQLTECMVQQKRTKLKGTPPTLEVEIPEIPGTFKTIKDANSTRILGANLQANLHWMSHMETGKKSLLPAVRRQMGLLQHIGGKIPMTSRQNLAKGLIQSRLILFDATLGRCILQSNQ